MPAESFSIEPTAKTDPQNTTLVVLLPGFRDQYAANDFRHYQQRLNDEAVVDYLVREAKSKRSRQNLGLVLQVPAGAPDRQREAATEQSFRALLADHAQNAMSSSLMVIPRSLLLVALGIVVLLVSHYVGSGGGNSDEKTIMSAASSVVQVGAWVMLWTAFSGFFFEGGQKGRRAATLHKLARAPIRIRYDDN